MSNSASVLKTAEAALDKGDYSLCIKTVDLLLSSYPAETETGSKLSLLKVTAYMGKVMKKKRLIFAKN